MKMCEECNSKFASRIAIGGKYRNLKLRKRCLDCEPFVDTDKTNLVINNTKFCSSCGQIKNIDNFYKSSASKSGYQAWCKSCLINTNKYRYKHNPNIKKKTFEDSFHSGQKMQHICNEIKKKYGCSFCDEREPCVLDFHHVDPNTKEMSVSALASNKSKERLVNEINRCAVVCSNCHRKLHFGKLDSAKLKICKVKMEELFQKKGLKWYFR